MRFILTGVILLLLGVSIIIANDVKKVKGDISIVDFKKNNNDVSLITKAPKLNFAPKRTKLLSNVIKNALETYHYRHLKVNDSLSEKAFTEYIKKLDYGKQFLLEKDVNGLTQYKQKIDDQIVSGNLLLLKDAIRVLDVRIRQVDSFRLEIFKKDFNFKKKERLEVSSKKRKYVKSEKELKDLWRKMFKQATLSRILSKLEEQKDTNKNKNKKKKEKKLSYKEIVKKSKESISDKYKKVFSRLLKEKEDDHLETFFNSVSGVFDPHTTYMPPKTQEDFNIDISGSLEGIGAVLQEDGSYIKVVSIVTGGAAWRQKELEVNDIILMVAQGDEESVDLVDMRVDDAVRYIRGKKGTEVRLTVKKADGTRKVIPIIREVVQISASFAKSSVIQMKGQKKKYGYIHVPKFYRAFDNKNKRNCTDDVKKEIVRLKKAKVDGIILDLRNNGGGALEDSRQMAGLFIKEGPIVQVKNYSGKIDVLKDSDKSVMYDGPLIVMINRFSASASEIVAGALQDYGRAIIIGGEHTHGKGTVQAILRLDQGPLLNMFDTEMGALKVTIQKFYRITGASTQYKGISPDIALPDPYGYGENREQDLDYSLPWDEVKGLKYSPWKRKVKRLNEVISASKKRVKESFKFNQIVKSIKYLKKRSEDTNISLNLEGIKKEDEDNKKIIDKLKYDKINKDVLVTHFEESLMSSEKIQEADKELWKEDLKKRKKEWVEGLQKDPAIEEGVHILNDIIAYSI